MSTSTWPGRRYDLIWLTLDTNKTDIVAVIDVLPNWVDRVKMDGTRIVIFGVNGPHWRRPAVQQLIDTNILHYSKHRVCHRPLVPLAPGARPSAASFIALTGEPIPSQLCRCSVGLADHVQDWTTHGHLNRYLDLMCREILVFGSLPPGFFWLSSTTGT